MLSSITDNCTIETNIRNLTEQQKRTLMFSVLLIQPLSVPQEGFSYYLISSTYMQYMYFLN